LRLLGDREGTPLPGYLHCTLPSAAVYDTENMWGLCFGGYPELRLRLFGGYPKKGMHSFQ